MTSNLTTASAQAATAGLKPLRLQKPADWPVWLSVIRMIAQGDRIWELVNPDVEEKPLGIEEPIAPTFVDSDSIDFNAYAIYKARKELYKERLEPYLKQEEALKLFVRYIQSSIFSEAAVFISEETVAHP